MSQLPRKRKELFGDLPHDDEPLVTPQTHARRLQVEDIDARGAGLEIHLFCRNCDRMVKLAETAVIGWVRELPDVAGELTGESVVMLELMCGGCKQVARIDGARLGWSA